MKTRNSLKTNLIYTVIYQISALILPLITAPYISRIIGAKGLGTYSYYHSIALYFVYFAMLGISNYANRLISKNSKDKASLNKNFSSVYFLQLITSLFVFLAYIIFIILFAKNDLLVASIMIFHIISAIFDVSWLFFGLQEFKITSIRQLIIRIVSFISIFIFVKNENDLWIYTLIMSFSYFAAAFSLWIMMFKKVKIQKCSFKEIFKHLKPCLILFIPIIASSIYRVMDKIMIGQFNDMTNVGYYESAEKLIFISSGILGAICSVVMPKISNLIGNKKIDAAKNIFNLTTIFCMFLTFAIAFGIAGVSKEFIPMFFGDDFINSINISILLCISLPFMIWSMLIRNLYLIPYELDKIYVKSVIIGAVVNFITNLILIPIIGVYGAAIGTIIADICLAFFQTYPIRKNLDIKLFSKYIAIYILYGIVMIIGIEIIKHCISSRLLCIITEITVGGMIYIILNIITMKKNQNFSIEKIRKILKN